MQAKPASLSISTKIVEMAHQVPTSEPDTITAGDLITWKISHGDYPAGDGWALSYALTSATALISITSSASGDDHLISVAAATSAAWVAGTYAIQGYATNGSARHLVYKGDIKILPDLAAASGGLDNRSHVKKTLDLLEAAMESLATGTMTSTSILGTTYTRKNMVSELIPAIEKYKVFYRQEQDAERIQQGKSPRGVHRIHFMQTR